MCQKIGAFENEWDLLLVNARMMRTKLGVGLRRRRAYLLRNEEGRTYLIKQSPESDRFARHFNETRYLSRVSAV